MLSHWAPTQLRTASTSVLDTPDQELRAELLKRLVLQRLLGPTQRLAEHHDPERLPMRLLPPGTIATLYLMYCAQCKVSRETPASRTVFYEAYKPWWVCLRFRKKAIMHFAMSAQNCAQESTTLASLGTYGPLINKQTNDIESNLFVLFLLKQCQVNRFKRKWEIKPRISRSMHVCAISCWPTTRISTANVKCTGQPVLKVDFVINFCALSSIHSIKRRCRSRSGPTDEYQNGRYMKKPDETWTHLIHWWCHVF